MSSYIKKHEFPHGELFWRKRPQKRKYSHHHFFWINWTGLFYHSLYVLTLPVVGSVSQHCFSVMRGGSTLVTIFFIMQRLSNYAFLLACYRSVCMLLPRFILSRGIVFMHDLGSLFLSFSAYRYIFFADVYSVCLYLTYVITRVCIWYVCTSHTSLHGSVHLVCLYHTSLHDGTFVSYLYRFYSADVYMVCLYLR